MKRIVPFACLALAILLWLAFPVTFPVGKQAASETPGSPATGGGSRNANHASSAPADANEVFEPGKRDRAAGEEDRPGYRDSARSANLRGSQQVENRDFESALRDFEKALALEKDNPSVLFNIAEVYFVTDQWEKAAVGFGGVLDRLPADNIPLKRLVEFKILLCKNKLGRGGEVTALAGNHRGETDSPYEHYANAAMAYERGDVATAEKWMGDAAEIFPDARTLAPWQDTMFEYGYPQNP